MEQHKQEITTSVVSLFFKFGFSILIGVLSKISYDVVSGRKLSIWAWCGIAFLSIFAGYISGVIGEYYHLSPEAIRIVVPISTLMGEKLITFVMVRFGIILKNWVLDNLDSIKERITGKEKNP